MGCARPEIEGLFTNYGEGGGGLQNGRGEACKVLPLRKGGAEKVGRFYAVARSFSHNEGERKKFPLFKKGCGRGGGGEKFDPVTRGGRKKFLTRKFPIL